MGNLYYLDLTLFLCAHISQRVPESMVSVYPVYIFPLRPQYQMYCQICTYIILYSRHFQGSQCQECKPLFLGDPRHGIRCTSCTEFCNEHSNVCLYYTDLPKGPLIEQLLQNYSSAKSPAFIQAVRPQLKWVFLPLWKIAYIA